MGKSDNKILDYIVVGQGLAGSAIAIHLFRRNRRFVVFDDPSISNSSQVAAGLFNPITGKNWVKTWKADLLFPYFLDYCEDVELMLRKELLFRKPIYRPFDDLARQNDWMGKNTDPSYVPYINRVHTQPYFDAIIQDPFGGLLLNFSGYLNIPVYLEAVKELLLNTESYVSKKLISSEIEILKGYIKYKEFRARNIIFCDGSAGFHDSLWSFLPFRRVKGEVLTIKTGIDFEVIFSKGVFVNSMGDMMCKVGSTYDHQNLSGGPTEDAKNQILNKLSGFFKPVFEVVDHVAGIRPATLDRRPFIGRHPNAKNIVIFNGLGTKGVTLAPYYANQLIDHMEKDLLLDREVNIKRYIK